MPRTIEIGKVGRPSEPHALGPLGGAREAGREEPEGDVPSAVEDERRTGIAGESGGEPLAEQAAHRGGAAGRPEPTGDDRLGDGRREPRPEEPSVQGIEPVAVEPLHRPRERPVRRGAQADRLRGGARQDESTDELGSSRGQVHGHVAAQ